MQTLVALARAGGRVVSQGELITRCWEGRIVGEEAINRVIGRLRRVSEADNAQSFTIETVPRVGFRLMARQALAAAQAGPVGGLPAFEPRKRALTPILIAAAGIAMAAGAAAIFWLYAGPRTSEAASVPPRVAVRLFQALGEDPQLHQFAGGLQAEIAGELSDNQIPVVSIHAGATTTPAAYVFDGTVERRGANLLVRVHLDDARQVVTVWSSDFSGTSGAPEVLQKEIGALASVVGKSALDFDATAKGDSDAMGLYIKAHLYSVPEEAKWDDWRKLAGRFPRSSDLQSDFALISAALAVTALPVRAAELRSVARTGAQRALTLNPITPMPFFAQVLSYPSIGHWAERENLLL
jgi:TolB-like protein